MVYVPIVFGLKQETIWKEGRKELVHRMKYTRNTFLYANGIDKLMGTCSYSRIQVIIKLQDRQTNKQTDRQTPTKNVFTELTGFLKQCNL